MAIAAIILSGTASLFTNIARTSFSLSAKHHGTLAIFRSYAAITEALRSLERNRLSFAVQVTPGNNLTLPHGIPHPLASLAGTSAPRGDSDVLSVIDVAYQYRGAVTESTVSGNSIEATICGFYKRPSSGNFKSFLVYTIEGARQVVGDLRALNGECVQLTGTSLRGLVSAEPIFSSQPLSFAPIEREYSLFVDRSANFRIASHIGLRITENQPIIRGLHFMRITRHQEVQGATTFTVQLRPTLGRLFTSFVTPGLSQRYIWNEVLT